MEHHDLIVEVVEPAEGIGGGALFRVAQRPDPSCLHPGGCRERRHIQKRGHVGTLAQSGAGGAAAVQNDQIGRPLCFGNLPAQRFNPLRIEQRFDFTIDAFAEEQNGINLPVFRQSLREHLFQLIRIFICATDIDPLNAFSSGGFFDAFYQTVKLRSDIAVERQKTVFWSRLKKFFPDSTVPRGHRILQLRRQFRRVERLRINIRIRFEHETHKKSPSVSFCSFIVLF